MLKKVVLAGYYGYCNAGDELILKSILIGMRQHLPGLKISVLNKYSKPSAGKVKYIKRYNPITIFAELLSSNSLIMGGGSIIQDQSGFFSIYYYFLLMVSAKLLKKRLIIFNQGLGPIKKKINIFLAKIIFSTADLIIVRDKYSYRFMKNLLRKDKKIILGADPVFYYADTEPLKKNDFTRKSYKKIGFSIRKWKNEPIEDKFIKLAESFAKNGWKCYNIKLHKNVDNLRLRGIPNVSWKEPEDLLKEIASFDGLCGMRLHSLILGAIKDVSMVGINYDIKIKSFCSFMDIPCFELKDMDIEAVKIKLSEEMDKKKDYFEKLKILRMRLSKSWKEIASLLRGC